MILNITIKFTRAQMKEDQKTLKKTKIRKINSLVFQKRNKMNYRINDLDIITQRTSEGRK